MNVNVVGTFLVTKAFLPLLRKKPSRVVVNMSSGQGSISHNRLAFTHPERNPLGAQWIAYNASKAAVNMRESSHQPALISNYSAAAFRLRSYGLYHIK